MKLSKTITYLLTPLYLFILPAGLAAAECSAKSGTQTVPLLELYTSEGCSSCPPIDKWLSSLRLDGKKIVPLAFHVDYWDYIGWKDKFSKSQFSDRQRKAAAFGGAGFVYTPQLMFNGRDFRSLDVNDSYHSRLNQAIDSSTKLPSRVNLTLDTSQLPNGNLLIKTTAQAVKPADAKNADIFIAFYENKLVSQVNAGDNNGRELKHDYVVRDLLGAYQFSNTQEFSKNFTLPPVWKNREAGAVIFVQDSRNGEILQSLQLPFCS